MARGLQVVVQVLAYLPRAGCRVSPKQIFQLREQVRLRAEMAEALVCARDRFRELLFHAGTIVAMEAVAFDEGRLDVLAAEDLLESLADRGGAGSRGAGDCDDRMAGGHGYRLGLGQTC